MKIKDIHLQGNSFGYVDQLVDISVGMDVGAGVVRRLIKMDIGGHDSIIKGF